VWRWMFIRKIKKFIKNGIMVDVASATGEMAKTVFDKIYFIEPSAEMVKIIINKLKIKNEKCKVFVMKNGKWKMENEKLKMTNEKWKIECGNKEYIIIQDTAENFIIDEKADLITSFMGLRNFDNLKKGMDNLTAHLKDGGFCAIVEMVKSDSIMAKIIMWYMNKIVPLIAGMVLGMKEEYKLLGKSVNSLDEEDILKNLKGYEIVMKEKLIFPVATLIIAKKNGRQDI
jgi:demethylmenaquinone methyltransferase/2-methoxy-6-polyprenyl-1,4-benzoquinol methylase